MVLTIPLVLDILLMLLLVVGTVALAYLTVVLMRLHTLLGRIEQVIGYAARVQRIVESWEALPRQIFGWIIDVIPQFIPQKSPRKSK